MKVKFSFLRAASFLNGTADKFARVSYSTTEGYIDGELTMQAPTGGIAWVVSDDFLMKFH